MVQGDWTGDQGSVSLKATILPFFLVGPEMVPSRNGLALVLD